MADPRRPTRTRRHDDLVSEPSELFVLEFFHFPVNRLLYSMDLIVDDSLLGLGELLGAVIL